jgi:MerR family transcriptional regulator, copper efflux regulator
VSLLDPGTASTLIISRMDPMKPLRSGELARLAGVSTDTLRYYERHRLLPTIPRATNGYRCYPPQAVDRVALIRRALGLGFSVTELARILKARDAGGAPCKTVRALAAEKLQQVEQQMRDLTRFRTELRGVLREWDQRLAGSLASPVRLLESMRVAPKRPASRLRPK